MVDIPKELKSIAIKYNVPVQRDIENCGDNCGACAGRVIYLGRFDDPEIEIIAFFHELGHALSNELVCKRAQVMTTISGEGLAWELGLGIAFKHGYEWDYHSYVMVWAREQFKTYIKDENMV